MPGDQPQPAQAQPAQAQPVQPQPAQRRRRLAIVPLLLAGLVLVLVLLVPLSSLLTVARMPMLRPMGMPMPARRSSNDTKFARFRSSRDGFP